MTGYLDFTGPEQLRTRGTVLVLPGRGESPASYVRFGNRLAADSYRVRVLPPVTPAADAAGIPAATDEALTAALVDLTGDGLVGPLVLVGADAGAAALAALVAGAGSGPAAPWWPEAVVLAGLPGYGAYRTGGWGDELDARTHCSVHRGVLSDDPAVRPGALADPVAPALLDAAYTSTAPLPHLLLVGEADPLADREQLAGLAKSLPRARLAVVRGAHHDVLNDLQHRSVAAEIVGFLEALRNVPALTPVVAVASSAW